MSRKTDVGHGCAQLAPPGRARCGRTRFLTAAAESSECYFIGRRGNGNCLLVLCFYFFPGAL